uniref:Uncharacterized protein n=1 Tax=Cacopsylla melanoneura TaxID=428564 RepID=A0A8D8Z825_9HEMI
MKMSSLSENCCRYHYFELNIVPALLQVCQSHFSSLPPIPLFHALSPFFLFSPLFIIIFQVHHVSLSYLLKRESLPFFYSFFVLSLSLFLLLFYDTLSPFSLPLSTLYKLQDNKITDFLMCALSLSLSHSLPVILN